MTLDPRINAYREDLAAGYLQSKVRAPRYSAGEARQVAAPAAPIRIAPKFDAPLATEALMGELLTLYDMREGWGWVQLREDGYVGYAPLDHLSSVIEENTLRVSARLTYLYPAPDIKRVPITRLTFSSTVSPIGKPEGRFIELSRGGFVFADHLVGIKERARDFVRVAERFVGVPYFWGGKTSVGIDCSGLVQISLQAAGIPCPRDCDMQLDALGEPVSVRNLDAIQRGDLLFWKGHVAIAQSGDWMIHASGHHMEVVVEPIRRAIERIGESHGTLIAIKRLAVEQPSQQPTRAARPEPAQAAASPVKAEGEAAKAQPPKQDGPSAPQGQTTAAAAKAEAPKPANAPEPPQAPEPAKAK